ncbi:radical SAM protein [Bailinhaonella thermotolerans]|uniref:Radical SAM protein n=1 Tax=Bailinhaonella thermotolerans TaxID=1070861 RepID=A0A3A4AUV7_9ACTN|nr:radical SAM protein [Bailinhaonella thermotolerans]
MDLTRLCQQQCTHCYNSSGPDGTHGTMTRHDWERVLGEGAALGATMVQFIGGEPTLYPDLPHLIRYALNAGLRVEVYSNFVRVTPALWRTFDQPGVQLATSYYSLDPAQHAAITRRGTLPRIEANISEAVRRGIPLRVGLIDVLDGQHVEDARDRLARLGVSNMDVDQVRLLGRASVPTKPADASQLCGRCGDGRIAILPDGTVTPCPLSPWLVAGSVHEQQLADLAAEASRIAENEIVPALPNACRPPCDPSCKPGCDPGVADPDGCNPRGKCNPNEPCKPQLGTCKPDVKRR